MEKIGKRVLKNLGIREDLTVGELLKALKMEDVLEEDDSEVSGEMKVSDLIGEATKDIKLDDFVIQNEFTVMGVFDKPNGKWPSFIKDSVFVDQVNI